MVGGLTEEQSHIRDVARDVARDVYAPKAEAWDREAVLFPVEERRRLGELGFLGITISPEYGGTGATLMDALIVLEELAKECRPAAFQVFEAATGAARHIEVLGTPEQRRRILPGVVTGEAGVAIAMSEPDAGSAVTDLTTSVKRSGDDFVLQGSKRWISGGGHADHYLVYARFDDIPRAAGIGAVIVDATMPGVSFGAQESLMGFRGIPSADIYFDNVTVPAENLVRGPGHFRELFRSFSLERLGNATMSLAIGQAALDRTLAYVQQRQQFGRPIVEFQSVQHSLADMVVQMEAARLLVYRAAERAGTGLPEPLEVSIAKCMANETAKRVTDLGMQLHGGNGYTVEYGLERLHRDAHGWAIAGGTPAMQRTRIVSELLGRSFDQRR
jgi:alkylation response protein AidB-like acyl-CoA dehydrogenase